MCFTQEMSGFFSVGSILMAIYGYRKYENRQLAIAILYFGAMETLQFVQYFFVARPEDDYAMCVDSTNQFLTVLGGLHICFQPYFTHLAQFRFRYASLQNRLEKDLVGKICLLGGVWCVSRYLAAVMYPDNPNLAPRATEDCPNYEWLGEGYDPYLKEHTPNIPGHSCTFIPKSDTRHLAWALPMYQASYFSPGVGLHTFLMFAPTFFTGRPFVSVLLFLTGPGLAAVLTASLNEQAAVWCYFSICQLLLLVFFMPDPRDHNSTPPEKIVHEGYAGEPRLEYQLVHTATNGSASKNGKKKAT